MNLKIWVLEIGEPLPLEKDVRLHRYGVFTKYLAEQGQETTWWTSSFSHAPKKHLVEQDTDLKEGNLTIKLIKGPGYPRNISLERIKHNRHFAKRFLELAPNVPKPDLIIAPIPTIEIANAALEFAKKNNIKILLDIRDLWPDEIVDLLPRPFRFMGKVALFKSYNMMASICKSVDGIMGVSSEYLNYGLSFAQRDKKAEDFIFPLGYPLTTFPESKIQDAEKWYQSLNINNDSFKICFFGTLGRYFNINTLIEAAKIMPEITFIIGGDGSSLEKYKNKSKNIKNIKFLGWLNGPQIHTIMKHSNAGIAPYKEDAKMTLPNKPFEYMFGSLPVISSLKGDFKKLIETQNIGVNYNPSDPNDLVKKIKDLKDDMQNTVLMGKNGNKVLLENFSTDIVYRNTLKHFKSLF